MPHALVIHGPGGWGEPLLADALALRLIERDTSQRGAADAIAHPDLRWIVPEGAGESIGIDAVRARRGLHRTNAADRAAQGRGHHARGVR